MQVDQPCFDRVPTLGRTSGPGRRDEPRRQVPSLPFDHQWERRPVDSPHTRPESPARDNLALAPRTTDGWFHRRNWQPGSGRLGKKRHATLGALPAGRLYAWLAIFL